MLEKACKRGTSYPNNGCEGDQVISFSREGIQAGLPLHTTLLFMLFDIYLFWMTNKYVDQNGLDQFSNCVSKAVRMQEMAFG